ncbi:hypothetical protein MAR_032009 [Mya arenaria]|uniref:BTB domain-containing protein n=1 Tax=Mya arenaria TaxID=6604 RepID=A0ABY7F5I5_MYAAR|nr:hypothetical protein MAR_032009 [Mya arenaria]
MSPMSGEQQSKSIASPSSRGMDMCSSVAVNKAVMKQLYNQMLKQSNFCDTTVSFGEGDNWASMKAHWCVLVHSPYFQSMYRSGLREKQQEGHSEVLEFIRAHLPEVMSQPEALKMSSDLLGNEFYVNEVIIKCMVLLVL